MAGWRNFAPVHCVDTVRVREYKTLMRTFLFALALACLLPASALAWPGTMLDVPDGDTVMVAPSGDRKTPVTVRLYGIDAPELGQPYGPESRDWLRDVLPTGTPVEVIPYSQDRYGRVVGLIQRHKADGRDVQTINGELVAAGLAWVYWPYCKERFCRSWGKDEKKAKREKLGLWQNGKPERPDRWRKRNPRK